MDPDSSNDAAHSVIDEYLRVASLAIGGYVYLSTLPIEWRFYRAQPSFLGMSQSCLLFILNRYMSIAALVVSNVGFFSKFSELACRQFFLVPPSFKVMAALISQIIIGRRTYTLSGRATWVKWSLVVLFGLSTVLEWFSNIYQRAPVWDSDDPARQACVSGNEIIRIAWIHYMISIIYDTFALGVATGYLCKYTFSPGQFPHLLRRMLFEGLGYFVAMTAVNIVNLIMYLGSEVTQPAAASLGYTIAWIMGQRILVNQFEAVMERKTEYERATSNVLLASKDIHTPRSQREGAKKIAYSESTITPYYPASVGGDTGSNSEVDSADMEQTNLGVSVHIERAVKIDPPTKAWQKPPRSSYRSVRTLSADLPTFANTSNV